ncbi:hypothetical protein KKG46_03780 [Patescibacteria group bacterium]|nr:hypothetical protein [Patescibacteria group bacterium]
MTEDRELTRKLVDLILSGKVPERDMREQLARYSVNDATNERLVYWETCFPGKGEDILAILSPFYEWVPRLGQPIPNIEQEARMAVFWTGVTDVVCYEVNSIDEAYKSLDVDLWTSFKSSLVGTMGTSLGVEVNAEMRGLLRGSLWDTLDGKFKGEFRDSVFQSLRSEQWFVARELCGNILWAQLWSSYCADLGLQLGNLLFYSCGFVLQGKQNEVKYSQKLLRFWLKGNPPLGIDGEQRLVFLVANKKDSI